LDPMRLHFVRHGESEANVLHEVSNRPGRHGLTDRGRQQAASLAERLSVSTVTRIYASPLLRALQTAEILSQALHVDYEVTDALREYDCGVLEGKSDAATWQTHADVSNSWLIRGDWQARCEGGESFEEIRQRFVPFIETLTGPAGGSSEEFILVGHGGTYRCMLPQILRNVDFAFTREHGIDHTDVILAEDWPDGLHCRAWGPYAFAD
jgi:2,3-bisphosphoglycerate-dependent phosphoglycerate mutase